MENPIPEEIEQAWLKEAHRRRNRMLSGEDQPIPGEEVFDEIEKRFGRYGLEDSGGVA